MGRKGGHNHQKAHRQKQQQSQRQKNRDSDNGSNSQGNKKWQQKNNRGQAAFTDTAVFGPQLKQMGLKLRPIVGDGNCLFRALSHQESGVEGSHLRIRNDVVNYMRTNREDFEYFVDGDFDTYLRELNTNGVFGGNDSIVAYSRLNNANVVIHQENQKMWEISPMVGSGTRTYHLAYHQYEHYSSVIPADDRMVLNASSNGSSSRPKNTIVTEQESRIMQYTSVEDLDIIRDVLVSCDYDEDTAVDLLCQYNFENEVQKDYIQDTPELKAEEPKKQGLNNAAEEIRKKRQRQRQAKAQAAKAKAVVPPEMSNTTTFPSITPIETSTSTSTSSSTTTTITTTTTTTITTTITTTTELPITVSTANISNISSSSWSSPTPMASPLSYASITSVSDTLEKDPKNKNTSDPMHHVGEITSLEISEGTNGHDNSIDNTVSASTGESKSDTGDDGYGEFKPVAPRRKTAKEKKAERARVREEKAQKQKARYRREQGLTGDDEDVDEGVVYEFRIQDFETVAI